MFQTFDNTSTPDQGPPRLAALRAAMQVASVDAWIVPRSDAWMGEYVAPCDARLEWLTGFTGSAGFCVVTARQAAIFVDGRYRVQVRQQVADSFTVVNWPETELTHWLNDTLPKGAVVGFDPWVHPVASVTEWIAACPDITFEPHGNLIDPLWTDRPARPEAPYFDHDVALAGDSSVDKRVRLAKDLSAKGTDTVLITLPDSIAWLLNIRGADVQRNPVPQAFCLLHQDGTADLFAPEHKTQSLTLGDTVRRHDIEALIPQLKALGGAVQIDPASCPHILRDALDAATVTEGRDPCLLPKARKTPAELDGMRRAHARDAVAMVQFLAWLDEAAPAGGLTEIDVVTKLEGLRAQTNALRDISFDTICGAGPHGAIVHYRVTHESNRTIAPGELLLVDSGGQYVDGTTDITRTIPIGPPPADAVTCYTAVLRGMIAISRARFPTGLSGRDLDALARQFLWTQGRDYDHGTGHGVGAYLSVHEGPIAVSRRNTVPLEPGMILSNEPGYYREGAFGIRIENLIVVQHAERTETADARDMLAFETLTTVPFDRRLIDTATLCTDEVNWINQYHQRTWDLIGPLVSESTRAWLKQACAPL